MFVLILIAERVFEWLMVVCEQKHKSVIRAPLLGAAWSLQSSELYITTTVSFGCLPITRKNWSVFFSATVSMFHINIKTKSVTKAHMWDVISCRLWSDRMAQSAWDLTALLLSSWAKHCQPTFGSTADHVWHLSLGHLIVCLLFHSSNTLSACSD